MSARPLEGRICLVAGASRGVGRGIARALGEAGATVVVTGRSSEAGPRTEGRPETIEDAAHEVGAAGGRGHPYRCDHTNEREVDALVAWALRRFGRIDVAVSSVWGGNEGFDAAEAHRLGLVNAVVAAEDLEAHALAKAQALAAKPRAAMLATRRFLHGDRAALLAAIDAEAQAFTRALASDEARAAFMAFLSKPKAAAS